MAGAQEPTGHVMVRTTAIFRQEMTSGERAAFAVLGVIACALGLFLLTSGILYGTAGGSGYFAKGFLEWLVILGLFVVGIVNLVSGATRAEGSTTGMRVARLVIGVIVIVLAIIAIWPVLYPGNAIFGIDAYTFLWILVAVAFTLEGIFLILVGLVPHIERWQRGLAIGLGAVVLVFGILSWVSPQFTFFVVWILVAIALLVFGIRTLVTGISGVRVIAVSAEGVV